MCKKYIITQLYYITCVKLNKVSKFRNLFNILILIISIQIKVKYLE